MHNNNNQRQSRAASPTDVSYPQAHTSSFGSIENGNGNVSGIGSGMGALSIASASSASSSASSSLSTLTIIPSAFTNATSLASASSLSSYITFPSTLLPSALATPSPTAIFIRSLSYRYLLLLCLSLIVCVLSVHFFHLQPSQGLHKLVERFHPFMRSNHPVFSAPFPFPPVASYSYLPKSISSNSYAVSITSSSTVIATRFWSTSRESLYVFEDYIRHTLEYCDQIVVALNVELDKYDTKKWLRTRGFSEDQVIVLPIYPWIGVTQPLNIIVSFISSLYPTLSYIVFQSSEVRSYTEHLAALRDAIDDGQTLVVGACLSGMTCDAIALNSKHPSDDEETARQSKHVHNHQHQLEHNILTIDGTNNPWNTFAIWHLPSLRKTGFVLVSDEEGQSNELITTGNADNSIVHTHVSMKGQEEAPTISLLQFIATSQCSFEPGTRSAGRTPQSSEEEEIITNAAHAPLRNLKMNLQDTVTLRYSAKVVVFDRSYRPIEWASSIVRPVEHERKMKSKKYRAERHIRELGISAGFVVHVAAPSLYSSDDDELEDQIVRSSEAPVVPTKSVHSIHIS